MWAGLGALGGRGLFPSWTAFAKAAGPRRKEDEAYCGSGLPSGLGCEPRTPVFERLTNEWDKTDQTLGRQGFLSVPICTSLAVGGIGVG